MNITGYNRQDPGKSDMGPDSVESFLTPRLNDCFRPAAWTQMKLGSGVQVHEKCRTEKPNRDFDCTTVLRPYICPTRSMSKYFHGAVGTIKMRYHNAL